MIDIIRMLRVTRDGSSKDDRVELVAFIRVEPILFTSVGFPSNSFEDK
jgi:hypothetical protein